MMNFDIKSTSKEDGKEEILFTSSDKKRVVERVSNHTGVSKGEIIRLLDEGITIQTSFFFYEKV